MASPFVDFVRRSIEELRRLATGASRSADAAAGQAQSALRSAREAKEQVARVKPAITPSAALSSFRARFDEQRVDRAVTAGLRQIKEAGERAGRIVGLLGGIAGVSESSRSAASSLLSLAALTPGPAGAAAGLTLAVTQYVDGKIRESEARQAEAFRQTGDLLIRQANAEEQYEQDPRFRQERNEEARAIYVARRNNVTWEPRSALLMDGF